MTRDEIAELLPEVYRRGLVAGTPLFALLSAMEALLQPREMMLSALPDAFRPDRASAPFVRLLAGWTDLDRLLSGSGEAARFSAGLDQLRILVAASPELARWRGTARGLKMMLELATGAEGFTIDDRVAGPDGSPRPFHMRVVMPAAAAAHRDLIERIIALEKPVHVTHEIDQAASDQSNKRQT
jgi:phage tail-like protein